MWLEHPINCNTLPLLLNESKLELRASGIVATSRDVQDIKQILGRRIVFLRLCENYNNTFEVFFIVWGNDFISYFILWPLILYCGEIVIGKSLRVDILLTSKPSNAI